jgi:hypothetical protein
LRLAPVINAVLPSSLTRRVSFGAGDIVVRRAGRTIRRRAARRKQ